ncbi:thioredoxin domain-containing protein [Halomarina rubra]|uniref:Thioredoxin domain-containing protein n=1 Tax=Halomarina rubra TaxID=2071873 RepID=A0ABD6B1A2_9EURY|nr:thioredoxin domain-containing protein [Halomarina rubra]
MQLETMSPNPVWTADAYEETIATLRDHDDVVYKVWAGDWCKDCRKQLPDFAAALDAADVPVDRIEQFPVERGEDGKVGPGVEEYGIELIPTVVVERDGEELFRYVEDATVPPAVFVAQHLDEH